MYIALVNNTDPESLHTINVAQYRKSWSNTRDGIPYEYLPAYKFTLH